MMSNYNRGNDIAADDYADKLGQDQAYSDCIDAIASRKLESREWLATNIDALMACSDCVDGVTMFAWDIADVFTEGRGRHCFFDRLQNQLKARAYDQAEDEIDG